MEGSVWPDFRTIVSRTNSSRSSTSSIGSTGVGGGLDEKQQRFNILSQTRGLPFQKTNSIYNFKEEEEEAKQQQQLSSPCSTECDMMIFGSPKRLSSSINNDLFDDSTSIVNHLMEGLNLNSLHHHHHLQPQPLPPLQPPLPELSSCCITSLEEDVLLYCEACNENVCIECALKRHISHGIVLRPDMYIDSNMIDAVRTLENSIRITAETLCRVKAREEFVQIDLKKSIISLQDAIKKREEKLIESLKYIAYLKKNILQQQMQVLIKGMIKMAKLKSLSRDVQDILRLCAKPLEDDSIFFKSTDHMALSHSIQKFGMLTSNAYGPNCTIFGGDFFTYSKVRQPVKIHVHARDHLGTNRMEGGDQVCVVVTGPDNKFYPGGVIDCKNGKYIVTITFLTEGKHILSIAINGRDIQNSPFQVNVQSCRDYSTITAPKFKIQSEGTEIFCRPWGVCCDSLGNIYIADRSNNHIKIFDRSAVFIRSLGAYGTAPGEFDRPSGVAYDPKLNRLVVCDKDNHRIQIFDLTSLDEFVKPVIMFGQRGNKPGEFHYPWDCAINSQSEILISDTRNHRIQLFNCKGVFLRKYGYEGPLWKKFDSPRGVAFTHNDHIVVTDFNNHRLVLIHPDFMGERYIGGEGESAGKFKRPQGVAIDENGNIIVADSRNYRIQIFGPDGTFKYKFGKFGTGQNDEMDRPSGVCVTPTGLILVIDFGNNRLLAF